MAAGRSGGVGGFLKKTVLFLIGCGVLLALLRVFNYDPFGIVSWIWSWGEFIVTGISDFLTGNQSFRKITEKPS